MKYIFIVNPTSGKGRGKSVVPVIKQASEKRNLHFEIIMTEYPGHAKEIANLYSIKDDVCLIAVGGDGTIYEVLNGIRDQVCMAVIPAGTGNDYYRMILEEEMDLEAIINATLDGKLVKTDYGVCNSWRFHNCTTLGLDAKVNDRAIAMNKKYPIPNKVLYGIAAFLTVLKPQILDMTLTYAGKTMHKKVILAAVMNGKWYGGGFNPTPSADLQDGYFDVCVIESLSVPMMVKLLPKYFKGKHTQLPEVTMFKADEIQIQLEEKTMMQSDGETFEEDRVHFKLMKQALTLLVPKVSKLK